MKRNYKTFKEALQDILGKVISKEAVFSEKTVTQKLDDQRLVSICLSTNGRSNYYEILIVKIIDKNTGDIGKTIFELKCYTKPAWEHQNIKSTDYIWECRDEITWYGAEPTDASIKDLRDDVQKYIGLFK